jgi:hypothetical protein
MQWQVVVVVLDTQLDELDELSELHELHELQIHLDLVEVVVE